MDSITIDLWILIIGAAAGALAAAVAHGSLRLVIGAVLGAGVALALDVLRTLF
jgi:hypothetical protein